MSKKKIITVVAVLFFTCLVFYAARLLIHDIKASWPQRARIIFSIILGIAGLWISLRLYPIRRMFTLIVAYWCMFAFLSLQASAIQPSIRKMQEEMLYPVARIRANKSGGSGTVIYSQQDIGGKWHTYVLGCHHVIASNINIREDWDSLVKRKIRKEFLSTAYVETFRYNEFSRCVGGASSMEADIVAYDAQQDLALLRLRDTEAGYKYVAHTFPKNAFDEIQIFDPLWCSGAALGHSPIVTEGTLMCMDDEIEGNKYYLSSAMSIYGDSGGAIFRYSKERDRYEYIGVPARIPVIPAGFAQQAISWMGYGITLDRLYKFLDSFCYQFIYDDSLTIEECEAKREKKRAEARDQLLQLHGPVEGD